MDYFAIASSGTYPAPTPTMTQRAAYAVSYGLLSLLSTPTGTNTAGRMFQFLRIIYMAIKNKMRKR